MRGVTLPTHLQDVVGSEEMTVIGGFYEKRVFFVSSLNFPCYQKMVFLEFMGMAR
jgi:hypothetical protein